MKPAEMNKMFWSLRGKRNKKPRREYLADNVPHLAEDEQGPTRNQPTPSSEESTTQSLAIAVQIRYQVKVASAQV
jgi:hypothetical protein